MAIVLSVSSAGCGQPAVIEPRPDEATTSAPKFINTELERSEAACREGLEASGGVLCTLSWRFGHNEFASSIRTTFAPPKRLTDGRIVLGFEGGAPGAFYGERCDDVAFHSQQCPGSGRYRLLIKQGEAPAVELWSRELLYSASRPEAPTFILTASDQAAFDMFVSGTTDRRSAELQFVPNDPQLARMTKDVSQLFNMTGLADLRLGYQLTSNASFAPGTYGQ